MNRDAVYSRVEWWLRTHRSGNLTDHLTDGLLDGSLVGLMEQTGGWIHWCEVVDAERWYPMGAACALCGRRLSDE